MVDPVERLNSLWTFFLPEELQELSAIVEAYNVTSADTEDWAVAVGEYYVAAYGRPSEWHSYDMIGARVIYQLKNPHKYQSGKR